METFPVNIVDYDDQAHRAEVIALWKLVFAYDAPHNEPNLVIDKKIAMHDGLFFVAVANGTVSGTIMAGYDGHRGWIYSLAVLPEQREKGIGSALVKHAENRLSDLGCLKVNLQIIEGNESIKRFYAANGYTTESRISMGKRLQMS